MVNVHNEAQRGLSAPCSLGKTVGNEAQSAPCSSCSERENDARLRALLWEIKVETSAQSVPLSPCLMSPFLLLFGDNSR